MKSIRVFTKGFLIAAFLLLLCSLSSAFAAMPAAVGAVSGAASKAAGAAAQVQSMAGAAGVSLPGASSAVGSASGALNVQISYVDSSKFRKMKAYVSVEDMEGTPVTGIDAKLFNFTVDGDGKMPKSVKVTEFRNSAEGIDYSIIFSNNINLGSGLLNIQTSAIINFVDKLTEFDTVSIYTMGEDFVPLCEDVHKADFDLSTLTTVAVSDVTPRLYDSVSNLCQKVRDKKVGRRAVLVISDERDYNSRLNAQQFIARIQEYGVPIYSIGIRAPSSTTPVPLSEMAKHTNGKYYYCTMVRELQSTLDSVVNYIINAYIVDFKIGGIFGFGAIKGDNKKHTLGLSINVRESFGSSSKIFVAPKKILPWWLKLAFVVLAVVLVLALVFGLILLKRMNRKGLGITNRRCPDCGNRLKDSWDDCPFCKYMPELKKKKKKKDKKGKKGKK